MVEAEASVFKSAGTRAGTDTREVAVQLIAESHAPFGVQRRNPALEMAWLYAVSLLLENDAPWIMCCNLDLWDAQSGIQTNGCSLPKSRTISILSKIRNLF